MLCFDYCVLYLPHALFTQKMYDIILNTEFLYQFTSCILFLRAQWKDNSMIYVVSNYHKKSNQIIYVRNCQIFTSAIKLSLIPAGVRSGTDISFLSIMLYSVNIYVTLYKNLCFV
jgi:hypothetical protein